MKIKLGLFLVTFFAASSLVMSSAPAFAKGGKGGPKSPSSSGAKSPRPAQGTGSNGSSHGVRGHVKKDGTYVAPHRATSPNKTQRDNYGTKGNTNPYNGKQGTKDAER